LNVGREKSTSLPADWGASGGRLLVGVDVDFTSELLPGAQDNTNGYTTVEIRRLAVVNGPSKFVSERGQKTVTFTDGGWCLRSQNDRSGAGPEAAHQLIGYNSFILNIFFLPYECMLRNPTLESSTS